ncbi:hypothetical protein F0M18_17300 [Pseudohalioglobus sediminis]|uniref:asparagine synthase (glutamine-hydrolyzing) n=1 Tax=Pseudohalioglobus sediminis TaxID=2606449 RepID=A0A5B0WSY2_9GAMM|nr:asparagine synthase-related protein [Pseudohalioglobus sediminis]KAA1188959.1 hypothetical protein F0M18_17300 [Pseudohalioglobus sediminis]
MSGVCGLLYLDGRPAQPAPVRAMLDAMDYRGPDGLHHACIGPVALGQARFHITRTAARTPLPYSVPGANLHLVFDGRLDNAPELAQSLGLAADTPDPELLAAAYLRWGDSCAAQLDGDFAFAIWDAGRERLLCARDHTGTRPFYYHLGKHFFAFATELPPLLDLAEGALQPNQDMVTQFLAQCWVSNEDTFWQGCKRLPPAHTLLVEQGRIALQRYWQPDFQHTLHYPNDSDYREHYLELITDIVRRQTRSDYPVAFEVSGGLDSSALFAVADDLHRHGRLQAPDIAGYTLDFRGCGDADEVAYAQAVGRHCGRSIELVAPTYQSLDWYLQRGKTRGEFCNAPNGVMTMGLFAQAARNGSRVLLNGTGGDEWLDGGDAAYAEALGRGRVTMLWRLLRDHAGRDGWPYALSRLARGGLGGNLPPAFRHALRDLLTAADEDEEHLAPEIIQHLRSLQATQRAAFNQAPTRVHWQRPLWHQANNAYALLAHETMEALAAESGLDMRRPYWSRRAVDFSISLPRGVLNRPGYNRSLHRDAMATLLPTEILQREDKAEFSFTFRGLTAELAGLVKTSGLPTGARWVQPEAFDARLQAALAGPAGTADWALWFLFSCMAAQQRAAAPIVKQAVLR